MNPDLAVDTAALRAAASDATAIAALVSSGVAEAPATVTLPCWATSDAAASAAGAAGHQLAGIAADIASTAQQVVAAVTAYEGADDRAASRLRATA
jgi:hypothetical protein